MAVSTVAAGQSQFSGALSSGVQFDGMTDYAQLDARLAAELSGRDQLTLEVRLSFESLNSYRGIFSFRKYYGQHNSYIFELQTSGYGGKYFATNVSNGLEDFRTANQTPIKTGREYMVTVVFDGTQRNPAARTKMYINGVRQQLTGGDHAPSTTPALSGDVPIYLAREGDRMTEVTLYEVRIWGTARSASEVAAASAATLANSRAGGLLALYDFTRPYGVSTQTGLPTLIDRTTNRYDAAVHVLNRSEALESAAVLPVELIDFGGTASQAGNLLEWTVMTEEDLSHYSIERSVDGNSRWDAIGEVPAEGSGTDEEYTYRFVDRTAGDAYYRLRMVDLDGTYDESDIVHVGSGIRANISVYPNPVTDQFTVQAPDREALNIELRDLSGRLIWQGEIAAGTGRHTHSTNGLRKGAYLLTVRSRKEVWTERLVVR